MGIFDKITGFFGTNADTINTGAKIAEKATEGVINGLDACFYTDEEKAQDKQVTAQMQQKGFETILEFQKQYASENSEQSKARRDLAKMTFVVFYSLIFILITIWRVDAAWCKSAIDIIKIISSNYILLMVAGAYFVPHQLSKIVGKK